MPIPRDDTIVELVTPIRVANEWVNVQVDNENRDIKLAP